MLKDITLGQFIPGDTVAHRLDPRTKLILTVLYIVALFSAEGWQAYLLATIAAAACFILSRVSFGAILRSMKAVVVIIIVTALLNVFFTKGEPIFTLWFLSVSREGVRTAFFMALRLTLLITGTFLLTCTTSPIALMDGLETLLSPLKKLRFPVHELAMMMSIALRFIPTLIEETEKIMNAQKARGADFESGGLVRRAKAMLPLLVPLFVSAFRRADELAVAMESRCYHGDEGRTRMKVLRMRWRDWTALALGLAVTAGVIILARVSP
ncbi:MAG: energy-coupling factor transporter transmembrane protein EcfT [Oscillospiraceae bacterium]|nr:energy-coupling factor transporter transmembrane protein EcfT [Oscillospiraceae bacterium]